MDMKGKALVSEAMKSERSLRSFLMSSISTMVTLRSSIVLPRLTGLEPFVSKIFRDALQQLIRIRAIV